MNIKEIPQILFDELSKKFGLGEEDTKGVVHNGFHYRFFRIHKDLDQPKAIGITKNLVLKDDCFVLWQTVPQIYESHGIMKVSSKPIASIFSKDDKTDFFTNFKGYEIEGKVFVRIEGDINITDRFTLTLLSLILERVSELAMGASHNTYWTKNWTRSEWMKV